MMKTYITEEQLNKIILEETKKVVEMIDSEEKGFLSKLKSFFNKRNKPPLALDDKNLLNAIDNYMEKYHPGDDYEIKDVQWGFQEPADMETYRVIASFDRDISRSGEKLPDREYIMWLEDGTREDPEEERGVPVDVNGAQMFLYGEW